MGAANMFDRQQGLEKQKANSNTSATNIRTPVFHIAFFHFKIKTIGIEAGSVYSS
jgi:hypothetical protein